MNKPQDTNIRWWDLSAASLLVAAMLISSARLIATRWTDNLTIVQMLVAFGVIAGLALGKSRFSPRVVAFFATAYGAFAIPWQIGATIHEEILWTERLTILLNRIGIILYQLFNQEPVQDSLLFLVFMSILFWILGVHSGYTLVRYGNAWKAIIPGGITLFVIHSFDPLFVRRTWYLAAYLFFALVLVARMSFLSRQNRWQQNRTALPPHLGFDFVRFAIIAALVIVLFAWTAPALAKALPAARNAWAPVREAWDDTKNNFENAFASLRATVGIISEVYGDSASLGFGNPLSQSLVFTVEPEELVPSGIRLYWRARTYDRYNDGRWLSTVNKISDFDPQDDNLNELQEEGRWTGTFKFTAAINPGTLFVPPQPLWVNRPGEVEYAENSDGTVDISTFRAIPGLQRGQEYQAIASVNNATVTQLRAAGEEYPEWVIERYLQLPDSITPRTRRLAESITAEYDNPYDKTVAITKYLRDNISYVDTLPETPPNDQDLVDWFLFDLRQGFCNYYSTSEIVMLRSIGIPARWAVGYARGELQNEPEAPSKYLVRHSDAHAWPEVYFPGIGWVEFEPTVSQPDISRLPGETTDELDQALLEDEDSRRLEDEFQAELEELRQENLQPGDAVPLQEDRMPLLIVSLIVAFSAVLLYFGWRMRDRIDVQATPIYVEKAMTRIGIRPPKALRLWARRAALPPLSRAYLEINRALARLGNKPVVNDTPNERATHLGQVLPEALAPANELVHEYQVATFSREAADVEIAQTAGKEIRKLSFKAFIQKLLARFQQSPRE
jgi:hypothetical protein